MDKRRGSIQGCIITSSGFLNDYAGTLGAYLSPYLGCQPSIIDEPGLIAAARLTEPPVPVARMSQRAEDPPPPGLPSTSFNMHTHPRFVLDVNSGSIRMS